MIDFSPTDDQRRFAEGAEQFAREVLEPAEILLDKEPNPARVFESDAFWGGMSRAFRMGYHKMGMGEPYGGLGLDMTTTGMVWESLARYGVGFAASLLPGAATQQLIALFASDNRELMERYVYPYCQDTTGRKISAWGSSEPNVGSDGSNYEDRSVRHHTTAVKQGDRWILNGTKSNFVSNGGIADVFLVFACVHPGDGLRGSGAFVVPGDAKGLSRGTAVDKIGLRSLNQAPLFFDSVEIPENYLIFPPGEGYPLLHNSIITVGNLGVAFLAVGLMRAAYEEALAYAKLRVQWGRPIVEHQMIMEKLFRAHIAVETARTYAMKGAWLVKTQFPGDLKTSLAAKIYATDRAIAVTADMVQVLGGYGLTKEYKLEKYARDANLLRVMDGTNETLMMKAAKHL